MTSFDLSSRLDALVPPELARGDWVDVTRRVRRRRRLLTPKLVLVLALFVVLGAAATATYLVLREGHPKPTPGALTVITGGYSPKTPAAIVEVRPGGRLVPVWRCPATQRCAELTSIAWAPDGRHLAFTLDSVACSCDSDGLHILDLQTGHEFHVFPTQAAQVGCHRRGVYWSSFGSVAWSPDGRTLAFTCPTGLHTIRSDGTGSRRVPTGRIDAGWATFSPDGRWMAFQGGTRRVDAGGVPDQGCCSVYVRRIDGSGLRRIAPGGTEPAWSPDGTRIAYRAQDGIRLVTPAGVDVTPGGRSLTPRGAPAWSPDGTRLAIGTRRGVFVVRATGARGRLVTTAGGGGAFGLLRPAWYPVARHRAARRRSTRGGDRPLVVSAAAWPSSAP